MSYRSGQIGVTVVCLVLGIMVAAQFHTTSLQKIKLTGVREAELSGMLVEQTKQLDLVSAERDQLRAQLQQQSQSSGLKSVLANAEMLAGLVAVHGPGIRFQLSEPEAQNPVAAEDLLRVANELWAADAEAICINEQRLVANTEIRAAGDNISINNVRIGAPYTIKAIGDAMSLKNALLLREGILDELKQYKIGVSPITELTDLVVPKYPRPFVFHYALPKGGD